MPRYNDGYDGTDSYGHKYYVRLRNSGFDQEDANLMAVVAVASDGNKSLVELIRRDGIIGLLNYARSHWPNMCTWIEDTWDTIKEFLGF